MAALITEGSFEAIKALVPESPEIVEYAEPPSGATVGAPSDVAERIKVSEIAAAEFPKSDAMWGLSLQSLRLTADIGGQFAKWFDKAQNIYFLAWAWDLSGEKPRTYPAAAVPEKCLIPLDEGELKLFLGEGVSLWPLRQVTAGLNVRLMLWNCKQGARDFGESMVKVHEAIGGSDLLREISALNALAGPTGVILDAIEAAADALVGIVGKILASEKDDYIDFYEGNYPVSEPWVKGTENYGGKVTQISLNRLVK